MKQEPTRRRFLGTIGATGLGITLAGCIGGATENDPTPTDDVSGTPGNSTTGTPDGTPTQSVPEPPENGAVAIVYDDGPIADYEEALPVHQEFGAPATTGVVSDWIGDEGHMDVAQIGALAEAGWEVASHTVQHTPLDETPLTADAKASDTRVYPGHTRHGLHEEYVLEVTNGNQSVERPIERIGSDDEGDYIELAAELGTSFSAKEGVVRYPAATVEDSLARSRRALEKHGFEVQSLLAPYDKFDAYSMQFVPEHYDYVANARPRTAINRPDHYGPYKTGRDYFVEFTNRQEVQQTLDQIAAIGGLGVFGAHTAKEAVSRDRIREMLGWVEQRNMEFMTLSEAGRIYANAGSSDSGSAGGSTNQSSNGSSA